MGKIIEYVIPEKKILDQSEYICDVIDLGRDGDGSGIYILRGGSEKRKEKVAGMLAVGWYNPIFHLEVEKEPEMDNLDLSGEMQKKADLFDIEKTLDILRNPHIEKKKEPEPMLGPNSGDKMLLIKSELHMLYDSSDIKGQKEWQMEQANRAEQELQYTVKNNKGDGYFLSGSSDFSVEKETCDVIHKLICERDSEKPFFIAVEGLSTNAIRNLQFEEEAKLITVREPGLDYYEDMLRFALEEKGCVLDKNADIEEIIYLIRNFRAENFDEDEFGKVVEIARKRAGEEERKELKLSDFNLFEESYESPEEKLDKMIGLQDAKEKLYRMVSLGKFNMERRGVGCTHHSYSVAFGGDPGTGKTEFAKIYAQILAKNGVTNGAFTIASKSDYIGKYVGHTAGLMRKLFERNRGGVIFFDEAATFLTDDDFTKEALTELVRFMEMYPDVVCIFASYEKNIQLLLERDQGLRSRITECIIFENYNNEELYEIFEHFCREEQLEVEDVRDIFYDFAEESRKNNADSFGNARFSRNLFEKTKEILAWETFQKKENAREIQIIRKEIVKEAIEKMRENGRKKGKKQITMGFYQSAKPVAERRQTHVI